jgi:hypothetical protein
MDFFTVTEAARRRGQIAIGYDLTKAGGPRAPKLNPKKGERVTFSPGDRIVVLATS